MAFDGLVQIPNEVRPAVHSHSTSRYDAVDEVAVAAPQLQNTIRRLYVFRKVILPQAAPENLPSRIKGKSRVVVALHHASELFAPAERQAQNHPETNSQRTEIVYVATLAFADSRM